MSDTASIDFHVVTQARVYLRHEPVGRLIRRSARQYSFAYDEAYVSRRDAIPLAEAFPVRWGEYLSETLHAFFDNLILEGWLLSQAEKLLHIDKGNRFAMLMAVGRHTIGAVSIVPLDGQAAELPDLATLLPADEPLDHHLLAPPYGNACPSCLLPSPHGAWHARCRQDMWGTSKQVCIALDAVDPLASFSRTVHGGSISGAQRKGLFRFDRESAALIPSAVGSTHILKPRGDHPELPENEHVTMAIARRLRFKVPPVALVGVPLPVGPIFVIKRFDRIAAGKLLTEDAAQLLGIPSADKYTTSNERVAGAIERRATKLDLTDFFRRLVFCFAIGNGDMHLKNWALLEDEALTGAMRLSPCYDLLNTRLALPRESIDIGLALRGKTRTLQGSYFRKFALETLALAPRYVESIFQELPVWQATISDLIGRSALLPASKERYLQIVAERLTNLARV